MKTLYIVSAFLLSISMLPSSAISKDYGTAEEAKAMLERAIEAIEKDKPTALSDFTEGKEMFKEKDLYVFCFDAGTGEIRAHGAKKSLVGQNVKILKDKTGFPLGDELFKNAVKGEFGEVSYLWPRPGENEPSKKSSYVTKVEELGCGVGYYK